MAAVVAKALVGGHLKSLGLRGRGDKEAGPSAGAAHPMTREELQELQQQLLEERVARDARFTQKKAERAALRTHFREKYRLGKSEQDAAQVRLAGGAVALPPALAKMVRSTHQQQQQQRKESPMLSSLPIPGVESLRDKTQDTLSGPRHAAKQKCSIM